MNYLENIDQLKNNTHIIVDLLQNTSQEQAEWKPKKDRWSILEVVNHITDIEINDFRHIFNMVLTNPEENWPEFDEQEWIVSKNYNGRDLKESLESLQKERNTSVSFLINLDQPDLETLHSGNGIGGNRMSLGDILASWIGHDLFHIRQLALLNWDILKKWSMPYSPNYSGFFS